MTTDAEIGSWARLVAASEEVLAELAAETLRQTKAARDAFWANMPDNRPTVTPPEEPVEENKKSSKKKAS